MSKLLIVGAGGHGRVVAEVAEDCGYDDIAFLDDNSPDAIGRIGELDKFLNEYKNAFVGIGSNLMRQQLMERMETAGFEIPVLIHPTAYVSRSAKIGKGTIVEPMAIVNANTDVGVGCIISVGAIVEHNMVVRNYCHLDAGAILKSPVAMTSLTKLQPGQIALDCDAGGKDI